VSDAGDSAGGTAARPPVALIHGWGGSFRSTWQPLGWDRRLAEAGREVVAVDLLGHGTSAAPHDPTAYDAMDRGVWSELPGDDVVDAVGYSLGARVLLQMACAAPDRFRRIVLTGVGANVFRGVAGDVIVAGMREGVTADMPSLAREFVTYGMHSGNDPQALAACLARPADPIEHDRVGAVDLPVLVLAGEDDRFIEAPERLAAAMPLGELSIVPGIDHLSTPYAPEVLRLALDFLDR
jgi:pimeloyl-ACP methyl ester carboxylesterase